MTTLALGYRAVQKKATSLGVLKMPWRGLFFFGVGVCLALTVIYVVLINQLTGGAYLIKNYNSQISNLLGQSNALQANFEGTGFLGSVQKKAKDLQFQRTAEITYVQILETSLAKAK